ncbi:MAG: hypothetical protein NC311_03210 [Muribaculaceae bacterium]|nr:hypothetical protein [Muribaculaceae bacterium]
MKKPDARPVSLTTGYLYPIYLDLKQLREKIDRLCQFMEKTEPWFDPENRRQN